MIDFIPASFNQKSALIELSDRYNMPRLKAELQARDILNVELPLDRYKQIRNNICYNTQDRALKLIQTYPLVYPNFLLNQIEVEKIEYSKLDIDPTGDFN